MKGSYTLLVGVSEKIEVEVGSIGEIEFREGFYAYNGSAFVSGGLKRVGRHKEKAKDGVDPHWHIDYLLIQQKAEIFEVFKSETDHECELSRKMSAIFEVRMVLVARTVAVVLTCFILRTVKI